MSWAGVLAALLGLAGKVLALFQARGQRQAGAQAQASAQKDQVIHDIETANDARRAAEHELAVHPERIREDDGFKRPD